MNKIFLQRRSILKFIKLIEIKNSVILTNGKFITVNDFNRANAIVSKKKKSFVTRAISLNSLTNVSEQLKDKANYIVSQINKFDSDIKITDFQLSRFLIKIWEASFKGNSKNNKFEEYVLEIEVQKKIKNVTILGSSYIYKSQLEDIKIEDIMKTITFPFRETSYKTIDFSKKYDVIVFGKPILSSILENLVYYSYLRNPEIKSDSNICIYDDPTCDIRFNYIPFDDLGHRTQIHHLYGYSNGYVCKPIEYKFLISNKNCRRDIRSNLNIHPTNVVLKGKNQVVTSEKIKRIKNGLYCHLIVGNHNCNGNFIEGTIFNAFNIKDGELFESLAPFKIKIDKNEFLENIIFVGDDYELERPFPWWTPMIANIPTVFTKNIRLDGS